MSAAKSNTFSLLYPFEFEGKTISEVTMRRAKGRDMERIDAAGRDFAAGLVTISCLTDLPIDAVREMDAEDITLLSERVADFLPRARVATGEVSSQT